MQSTKPPSDIGTIDDAFSEMVEATRVGIDLKAVNREMTLPGPFDAPGGVPTVPPDQTSANLSDRERGLRPTPFGGIPRVEAPPIHDRLTPMAMHVAVPAMRVTESKPFAWLAKRPGVLGHRHTDAAGTELSSDALPEGFGERIAFIRQMAQSVGDELGLENLREVHLLAKESRAVSVGLDGGGTIDFQTTQLSNTHDLAKQIRSI
jgi:hypothetical protein